MAKDLIKPTLPSDTKITVSNVTNKGFTVSWKAASDNATPASKLRYRVFWYEVIPGATAYVPTSIEMLGKTNYTFTNFKTGTEYCIYINVYNQLNRSVQYPSIRQKTSGAAPTVSADTIKPVLPADKKILVSSVTNKGFTISWKAASDNRTPASKLRYHVCWYEVIPGAAGFVPSSVDLIGKTNHTFTNFKSGTEYGVYIYVYDEARNSIQYPLIKHKTSGTTPPPQAQYTKETTEVVEKGRKSFDFELISATQANVVNSPNPTLTIKDNRLSLSYPNSSSYKGDWDIYTKKNKNTQVVITAGIQKTGKEIEIIVLYTVKQLHGDYTVLSLSKTYRYNNLAANDFENKEIKSWWELVGARPVILDVARTTYRGEKKGWLYVPAPNRYMNNLRVKIDGSGTENKKGNMGIKGTIYVDYQIKNTIKPQLIVESPVLAPLTVPTKGNYSKLSAISEKVKSILGRGMYISGQYASTDRDSLGEHVLNIDKLNEYQRIDKNTNGSTNSYEINKNGSSEYSKKLDTDLSVDVSLKFGVCSFSSETKKTFSEDRYNKETYKFITRKDVSCFEQYQIQGAKTPNELCAFLTDIFLADLNKLSSDKLVEKYGTHVMLGMKMGGRFDYNYSYLESINSVTTVNTFSTTNSVGVNMGKDGTLTKSMDYGKLFEKRDKALTEGNLDEAKKIVKQINELDELAKKGAGGSGGAGASITTKYTETETITGKTSEETFDSKVFVTGGAHQFGILINGETEMDKFKKHKEEWLRSLNKDNMAWCDYLGGTLIPIYEFIPTGKKLTRSSVERAYKDFIIKNCPQSKIIIGKGVQSYSLHAKGSKDVVSLNGDKEISTQDGKETYWKVTLELVNLVGESGNSRMGVAIWYEVHEGGKNAGRSLIQLKQVYDIYVSNKGNVAIDENLKTPRFTFDGTFVGKKHDWIDVTTQAMGCPFIDTTNHKFQVIIDGAGDNDGKNIAVKGVLSVPYQYYADKIGTK